MTKIILLESDMVNPGDITWEGIDRLGDFKSYPTSDRSTMINQAKEAEILILNKLKVDEELLQQLPNLKYICVSATGYDNVDLSATKKKGIPVSNVNSYSTESVAQHVFSLLLANIQKVAQYNDEVKEGKWTESERFSYFHEPIRALSDMSIGVWGYGNIGSKVGEIAHAFGMKVLSTTRSPEKVSEEYVEIVTLKELFSKSDVVSIHVPLISEYSETVDYALLSTMKSNAILINTARGGIIKEADLSRILHENKSQTALVDVLSKEPPASDHPLLSCDNCIITPHQAWASQYARKKLLKGIYKNIENYFSGNTINQV